MWWTKLLFSGNSNFKYKCWSGNCSPPYSTFTSMGIRSVQAACNLDPKCKTYHYNNYTKNGHLCDSSASIDNDDWKFLLYCIKIGDDKGMYGILDVWWSNKLYYKSLINVVLDHICIMVLVCKMNTDCPENRPICQNAVCKAKGIKKPNTYYQ